MNLHAIQSNCRPGGSGAIRSCPNRHRSCRASPGMVTRRNAPAQEFSGIDDLAGRDTFAVARILS